MKIPRAVCLIGLFSVLPLQADAKEKTPSSEVRLDGKTIQLARYAKAFIAKGNITVEMAPYKTEGGEGAILLFKGVESEWDEKAIDHKAINGGRDYATRYKGQQYVTLTVRDGKYTLYLPDVKDEIALAPSDGAAQLTTPQAIYQAYLEQNKKGGSK